MTSLNVTWRPDLIWPGVKILTQDARRMTEQLCQIWRRCAPPFFCYLRKTDGGGTYVPPPPPPAVRGLKLQRPQRHLYTGWPKKNVPNFAQVFSRSLSRYEGDIFQVYWASNLELMCDEFYHYLLIFLDVISFETDKRKNVFFFARFLNFVSNFKGVLSKLQHRNLHKIFSNT